MVFSTGTEASEAPRNAEHHITGLITLRLCFRKHNLKQLCVDGQLLRTGSANWSPSGEKREDDDADYSTDPKAIERFERDFEVLWNRSDNIVVQ